LAIIHLGGDEVNAAGFQSSSSCLGRQLDFEQLKQEFIGSVAQRAARLGLAVQAWDDALAGIAERPRDAGHWNDGKYGIFINAWNNNRLSNAFSYADAGYKVTSSTPSRPCNDSAMLACGALEIVAVIVITVSRSLQLAWGPSVLFCRHFCYIQD